MPRARSAMQEKKYTFNRPIHTRWQGDACIVAVLCLTSFRDNVNYNVHTGLFVSRNATEHSCCPRSGLYVFFGRWSQ